MTEIDEIDGGRGDMLLGIMLMALIWLPKPGGTGRIKHPFIYVGMVHSFVGTMFGVGGILQSLIIRTDLKKMQITGTLAACMLSLDVLKMTSYVSVGGVRYQDYIPHIVLATVAGFAGVASSSSSAMPFLKLLMPLATSPIRPEIRPPPNSSMTTRSTITQCISEKEPIFTYS